MTMRDEWIAAILTALDYDPTERLNTVYLGCMALAKIRDITGFRRPDRDTLSSLMDADLFKVYEVENIIQCATLSATASLERTESRWLPWHFRSDFPNRDDVNWKKHIVLTRGESPGEVHVTHKDIIKMQA